MFEVASISSMQGEANTKTGSKLAEIEPVKFADDKPAEVTAPRSVLFCILSVSQGRKRLMPSAGKPAVVPL